MTRLDDEATEVAAALRQALGAETVGVYLHTVERPLVPLPHGRSWST